MKSILKPQNLPWITSACGGIGLLLRLWLLVSADSSGFLPVWHISEILLWLLTAAVIGLLLYATRNLTQAAKYRFPPLAARGHRRLAGRAGHRRQLSGRAADRLRYFDRRHRGARADNRRGAGIPR